MAPPDLLHNLLPDAVAFVPAGATALPRWPGAYVLVMHLDPPVWFARPALPGAALGGWLVYAGSARGPGGIGARLGRHFRRGKPVHWHVDELTNAANRLSALAISGGSECAIVDRLLQSGQFEIAMPGFGSTDCRHCAAHLLQPQARA